MKESELRPCAICSKGMMHQGSPVFYRLTIEPMVINLGAVQRQAGLGIMLGSGPLAAIMGPDEDMAKSLAPTEVKNVLVCQACALQHGLMITHELIIRTKESLAEIAAEKKGGNP